MRFDLADKKVTLLLNRRSGRREGETVESQIRDAVAPVVGEFDVRRLGKGDNITNIARHAVDTGSDVILALGGDGTQAAVADALVGTDAVMAVLPGGTFNYFAREYGIGENWQAGLQTFLTGAVRKVSVGRVNDRVFLNNASFGAYPEILERREDHYKRWGRSRLGAYWAVISALGDLRKPMHLAVTVDGKTQTYETALVFVAKNAFQLESLGLDGADAVRDGHFALFIAHAHEPWGLVGAAIRLALGRVSKGSDFDMVVSDKISVETRPARRLVAYDGEKEKMVGPFTLEVLPDALSVIVPGEGGR